MGLARCTDVSQALVDAKAYTDAQIAAIPAATDTVQGKVSLAVAANYPSTSDTEATTPAYVAASLLSVFGN